MLKEDVNGLRYLFTVQFTEAPPRGASWSRLKDKRQRAWKIVTAFHFFHIFLCNSLIPKLNQLFSPLKFLHKMPENDNVEKKDVFTLSSIQTRSGGPSGEKSSQLHDADLYFFLLYPFPDLCFETILSWWSTDNSFDFMLGLCSNMNHHLWELIEVCAFPNHVQSSEITRGGLQ